MNTQQKSRRMENNKDPPDQRRSKLNLKSKRRIQENFPWQTVMKQTFKYRKAHKLFVDMPERNSTNQTKIRTQILCREITNPDQFRGIFWRKIFKWEERKWSNKGNRGTQNTIQTPSCKNQHFVSLFVALESHCSYGAMQKTVYDKDVCIVVLKIRER